MADPDPYAGLGIEDPYAGLGTEEAPAVSHVLHTFATRGPDGKEVRFQAPSDARDDDVRKAAAKATGSNLYLRSTVGRNGELLPDTRPTSFWEGVKQGLEQPLNRAAEWAEHIPGMASLNQFGADHFGTAPTVQAGEDAQALAHAQADSRPSAAGQFVGNVAGTLPLATLPGGVLAQGAAGGALLSQGRDWQSQALGAAAGGIGGAVGGAALRGAANLAAPVVAPALRTLIDAGVRPTLGQIARSSGTRLGNVVSAVEDKATSLPIAGNAIQAGRTQAQSDFGRATINRALEPIGQTLPRGVEGRAAVAHAGDALSKAYNQLTPRLSATGDQQFAQDLSDIHQDAAMMHPDRQAQFNSTLQALGRYFQNGVHLDGAAFKDIETRLGAQARNFTGALDPDARQLGAAYQQVMSAVRDLAARQNPQEAAQLGQINRGWASLTQAEKAAGNSRGDITPAGYSQAVKMSSNTVRRRSYARGEALNQDLSDAASAVLPSRVPDSGTGGRIGQLALGATGMAALGGNPEAIGAIVTDVATRLLYSQPAQNVARAALTRTTNISPGTAALLRVGSRVAPYVTPALEQEARRRVAPQ